MEALINRKTVKVVEGEPKTLEMSVTFPDLPAWGGRSVVVEHPFSEKRIRAALNAEYKSCSKAQAELDKDKARDAAQVVSLLEMTGFDGTGDIPFSLEDSET